MIRFWVEKRNRSWLRLTGSVISLSLLFSIISAPFAEANIWHDRRKHLQEKAEKEEKMSRAFQPEPQKKINGQSILSSISSLGIEIPEELGTIVESYEGKDDTNANFQGKSLPTVIHIQDAHGVYAAQKNASSILKLLQSSNESLVNQSLPLLVCVEGAWGRVSPEWLSVFPDEKIKKELAESLLQRAEITGEEYLGILQSPGKTKIYGIEEKEVYKSNLETRKLLDPERNIVLNRLSKIESRLQRLKRILYTKQLLELDAVSEQFENQKVTLKEYFSYLKKMPSNSWNPSKFPTLAILLDLFNQEEQLSTKKVEEERNGLMDYMSKTLDESTLTRLAQASLNFRMGKIKAQKYYQVLMKLAEVNNVPAPQMQQYVTYLKKTEELNSGKANDELKQLEKETYKGITNEEKVVELVETNFWLRMQKKFWNERFSPDDWKEYKEIVKDNGWTAVENYLAHEEKRLNLLSSPIQSPASSTQESRPYALRKNNNINIPATVTINRSNLSYQQMEFLQDSYYKLAFMRDKIMVENALEKTKQLGKDKTVLIAGGFHTPGMTALLKEKGIPYVVIRPKLTLPGQSLVSLPQGRFEKSNKDEGFIKALADVILGSSVRAITSLMAGLGISMDPQVAYHIATRADWVIELIGRLAAAKSEEEKNKILDEWDEKLTKLGETDEELAKIVKEIREKNQQIANLPTLVSENGDKYILGAFTGDESNREFGQINFVLVLDDKNQIKKFFAHDNGQELKNLLLNAGELEIIGNPDSLQNLESSFWPGSGFKANTKINKVTFSNTQPSPDSEEKTGESEKPTTSSEERERPTSQTNASSTRTGEEGTSTTNMNDDTPQGSSALTTENTYQAGKKFFEWINKVLKLLGLGLQIRTDNRAIETRFAWWWESPDILKIASLIGLNKLGIVSQKRHEKARDKFLEKHKKAPGTDEEQTSEQKEARGKGINSLVKWVWIGFGVSFGLMGLAGAIFIVPFVGLPAGIGLTLLSALATGGVGATIANAVRHAIYNIKNPQSPLTRSKDISGLGEEEREKEPWEITLEEAELRPSKPAEESVQRPKFSNEIDQERAQEYINAHGEGYREFVEYAISKIKHVSQDEFEKELEKTLKAFLKKLGDEPYAIVLLGREDESKSNNWVLGLAQEMGLLPQDAIIVRVAFDSERVDEKIKSELRKRNIKNFVFLDDAIYSGHQFFRTMAQLPSEARIHVAAPFVSTIAKSYVEWVAFGAALSEVEYYGRVMPTLYEIITEDGDLSEEKKERLLTYVSAKNSKPLFYFDHKVPDEWSAGKLLHGRVIDSDLVIPFIPPTKPPYKPHYQEWAEGRESKIKFPLQWLEFILDPDAAPQPSKAEISAELKAFLETGPNAFDALKQYLIGQIRSADPSRWSAQSVLDWLIQNELDVRSPRIGLVMDIFRNQEIAEYWRAKTYVGRETSLQTVEDILRAHLDTKSAFFDTESFAPRERSAYELLSDLRLIVKPQRTPESIQNFQAARVLAGQMDEIRRLVVAAHEKPVNSVPQLTERMAEHDGPFNLFRRVGLEDELRYLYSMDASRGDRQSLMEIYEETSQVRARKEEDKQRAEERAEQERKFRELDVDGELSRFSLPPPVSEVTPTMRPASASRSTTSSQKRKRPTSQKDVSSTTSGEERTPTAEITDDTPQRPSALTTENTYQAGRKFFAWINRVLKRLGLGLQVRTDSRAIETRFAWWWESPDLLKIASLKGLNKLGIVSQKRYEKARDKFLEKHKKAPGIDEEQTSEQKEARGKGINSLVKWVWIGFGVSFGLMGLAGAIFIVPFVGVPAGIGLTLLSALATGGAGATIANAVRHAIYNIKNPQAPLTAISFNIDEINKVEVLRGSERIDVEGWQAILNKAIVNLDIKPVEFNAEAFRNLEIEISPIIQSEFISNLISLLKTSGIPEEILVNLIFGQGKIFKKMTRENRRRVIGDVINDLNKSLGDELPIDLSVMKKSEIKKVKKAAFLLTVFLTIYNLSSPVAGSTHVSNKGLVGSLSAPLLMASVTEGNGLSKHLARTIISENFNIPYRLSLLYMSFKLGLVAGGVHHLVITGFSPVTTLSSALGFVWSSIKNLFAGGVQRVKKAVVEWAKKDESRQQERIEAGNEFESISEEITKTKTISEEEQYLIDKFIENYSSEITKQMGQGAILIDLHQLLEASSYELRGSALFEGLARAIGTAIGNGQDIQVVFSYDGTVDEAMLDDVRTLVKALGIPQTNFKLMREVEVREKLQRKDVSFSSTIYSMRHEWKDEFEKLGYTVLSPQKMLNDLILWLKENTNKIIESIEAMKSSMIELRVINIQA